MKQSNANVRYWPFADIPYVAFDVAFGGKADITKRTCPLSWSLLGVKRTWLVAAHMSAFDPKRT